MKPFRRQVLYVPAVPRGKPLGFTLVEVMITVAIVAVLGMIAIPSLRKLQERQAISRITREFAATIKEAQQSAVSRSHDSAPGVQLAAAGIWFANTTGTQYQLFIDNDANPANGVTVVRTVDFTADTALQQLTARFCTSTAAGCPASPAVNTDLLFFQTDGTARWQGAITAFFLEVTGFNASPVMYTINVTLVGGVTVRP